ncbi:MAG TPA: DUF3971 domain-containing protein, partial [Sulfuricurvum sp.]|nr:DUF3971 domain-containing protein [Sulfuricurvum sp.]
MKDTITTKIIPKTHKSVLLFLVFTFFLGFLTFVALLEGFSIDHLKFGGVKVEKLYLKWDKALHIKATKIDLTELSRDDVPLTLKPLSKLPRVIRWIEGWVDSIHITVIQYKDFKGSLHFQKNSIGNVTFGNSATRCEGTFELNETDFRLVLPSCRVKEANLSAALSINLRDQSIRSDIGLILPQTPLLNLSFVGDNDTLRFSVKAQTTLTTIKPLIDFLHLDPEVTPWIIDYAKASSIQIGRLEGLFHYDHPEELIETLTANATVMNGEYTFASGFEPIHSPRIDLHFSKGKLHIFPRNGTFYALPTEDSRVVIDFTTPHTMLNVYIKTAHAKLGDPIVSLLKFYDIHLPIKQLKGECDVNLYLSINLHDFETAVKGVFKPSSSEILLDLIPLKTEGGIVKIDRNHVTFENFIAHYGEDVAHARVEGDYNTAT